MKFPEVGQLIQILIATAGNMSFLEWGIPILSTDDHFQKKEQSRPKKIRDFVFTCCFENILHETRRMEMKLSGCDSFISVNED